MTMSTHALLLLFLAWTRTWTRGQAACPQDEGLRQLCYCEAGTNGILLDCSSGNFEAIKTQLQLSRPRLGLIQELLLQNVSVRSLPAAAFDGLFVKKLDLSFNSISAIDPNAFRGLENVLQILTLHKNELEQVPTEAFSKLANLLQLDLSKNKIGDLTRNILTGIPKLYDVNLSTNRICRIDKDAFEPLRLSLQSLNLGENCMERVPAPAIRGFQNLLALHLHGNQFRQLDALQFMNLPNLNLINLSQNQIAKIHTQAFLNVPNLKYLYLADNKLQQIDEKQFSPFQKLELLDLSRNDIQVLTSGSFGSLPRLSQLYLAENKIFDIQNNAFLNSSLVILLLSGNRLTTLNTNMFNGMNYLQQLSLKNNQIKDIPQNTFYQLPSLVVLDLSGNQLTHLPTATFLAQLSLFLLDLSRNQLKTIPYSALNQRIVTVILQENPLVCSERIHVIQNGVGVYVPESVDQICGGKSLPTGPTSNGLQPEGQNLPNSVLPNIGTGSGTTLQGLGQPQDANIQPSFVQANRVPGLGQPFNNANQGGFSNQFPLANRGFTPDQNVQPFGADPFTTLKPSVGQSFVEPHPVDDGTSLRTGDGQNTQDNRGPFGQNGDLAVPASNEFAGGRVPIDNLGHSTQIGPAIDRLGNGGGTNTGFWNNANQNVPPQLPSAWANLPKQPTFGGNPEGFFGPGNQANARGGNSNSFGPGTQDNARGGNSNSLPSNTIQVQTSTFDVLKNTSDPTPPNNNGWNPGRTNPWRPGVGTAGQPNSQVPFDSRPNSGNGPGSVFRPPRPGSPPYPVPPEDSGFRTIGPGVTATMPAGIIVGGENNRLGNGPDDQGGSANTWAPPSDTVRTIPPKPVKPNVNALQEDGSDGNGTRSRNRKPTMAASTIIAVALTVVVVVLIVVFVTLCIVRYRARQASRTGSDSSSATRTSAYVAAQAARLNYGVSNTAKTGTLTSSAFGGADYIRATQPAPAKATNSSSNTAANNNNNQQNAWLYTTGTYSAASHPPY